MVHINPRGSSAKKTTGRWKAHRYLRRAARSLTDEWVARGSDVRKGFFDAFLKPTQIFKTISYLQAWLRWRSEKPVVVYPDLF